MIDATMPAVMSSWLISMPVLSMIQLIGSSWIPRLRFRTSTPHMSCATPSMTNERPIVAINNVSSLWLTSGRSTKRSVAMPTSTITPIATGNAAQNGSPSSMTPTKVRTAKNTNEAL
jgi:hypothetical protein